MISEPLQIVIQEWDEWLRHNRRLSPTTLTTYHADLQQFLNFLGAHLGEEVLLSHLVELKVRDFRSWLAARTKDGYLLSSTTSVLSTIRNFFKYLNRVGYPNTAIQTIRSPRVKIGLPRSLQIDQTKNLLDDVDSLELEGWIGQRNKALFTLLYGCGLRISEALNLTRHQFPFGDCLIVKGKGNKERSIPVFPLISEEIERYISLCPYHLSPDSPLFMGAKGKKLSRGVVARTMRQYRQMVGLPDNTTPHSLRHSYATHLMSSSHDMRGVQELLGHASLSSTQIYTKVDQDYLMNVFNEAHPRAKKER